MPPVVAILFAVAGVVGSWFVARKMSGGALSLPGMRKGLEPATPVQVSAAHAAAHVEWRPIMIAAATKILGREPTTAEVQYLQAVGGGIEGFYGSGWSGAMVGSNNLGGNQCPSSEQGTPSAKAGEDTSTDTNDFMFGVGGSDSISRRLARLRDSVEIGAVGSAVIGVDYNCVDYGDKNPDGSSYPVKFKFYTSKQAGAEDLARAVLGRSSVDKALSSESPTAFRASLAMRRTKYYGGFCAKATAQYGAEAAKASFGTPERDAGTLACQAEAVTAHATAAASIIAQVATSCGDAERVPLGTLDDAISWYRSA